MPNISCCLPLLISESINKVFFPLLAYVIAVFEAIKLLPSDGLQLVTKTTFEFKCFILDNKTLKISLQEEVLEVTKLTSSFGTFPIFAITGIFNFSSMSYSVFIFSLNSVSIIIINPEIQK